MSGVRFFLTTHVGPGYIVVSTPDYRMSRSYPTASEAKATAAWLREREAGYPALDKFANGEAWAVHGGPCPRCEGGVGPHARRSRAP